MSITLKPKTIARLKLFKSAYKLKSFNDAIEVLLSDKIGAVGTQNNLFGISKFTIENLIDLYFKDYDSAAREIQYDSILAFIKNNLDLVFKRITQEDIDVYMFLQECFEISGGNIQENSVYKWLFRDYYENYTRDPLNDKEYNVLFSTLSNLYPLPSKGISGTLKTLLNELFFMRYKIEYEYATVLLHTLNPELPIYNRHLVRTLKLETNNVKHNDKQIQNLSHQYLTVIRSYTEFCKKETFKKIVKSIERERNLSGLTMTKIGDYLLSAYAKISHQTI